MSTDTPLFAIITAVRNDAAGFVRTHRSLQEQTFRGFEWIVIDGASNDGTPDQIKAANAEITALVSEPDRGVYDAMNKGLALASAPYVLFLNADDVLAGTDTLARLAQVARASMPDFIYGDAEEQAPDGKVLLKQARSHRAAWYGMFTHHQAMVYHRTVLNGLRYDLNYSIGADYDFTLRALQKSGIVFQAPFTICRCAPPGLSGKHTALGRRDQFLIRRKTLGYSAAKAHSISGMQVLAMALRKKHFPLYARLRNLKPKEFCIRRP